MKLVISRPHHQSPAGREILDDVMIIMEELVIRSYIADNIASDILYVLDKTGRSGKAGQ